MKNLLFLALLGTTLLAGCKKDDPDEEEAPTPDPTYTFSNVNYTNQTYRITMMSELDAEMNKGRTVGTTVSATKLKQMFANTGSQFTGAGLNTSGVQLKDITAAGAQTQIEFYFDSVASASALNSQTAADGVAGIGASTTSTGKYLLHSDGVEYSQVISKLVMGATFFYTIKNTYLSQSAIGTSVDNTTRAANWDNAFGLYGVPTDFPVNKTGLKYLGNYSNQVDPVIGTNSKVMSAYIKGRQAIVDQNTSVINSQAILVVDELEKLLAAAAIHELRAAKTNFSDVARRNHLVSEAIGFLLSLQYISNANLSVAEINTINGYLNFPAGSENLYDVTVSDLDDAINAISAQYDLDAYKSTLRVAAAE